MIPNYINSSPSPFPGGDHHDQNHHFFVPNNYQSASSSSSSSSLSCHVFFNSSSTQYQTEFYPTMIHRPPHHQQDENQAGSYDLEKKDIKKSLKLTLWKNNEKQSEDHNSGKWMSSKMRLMQKMKNSAKLEDQKQSSSSFVADHLSSNSSPVRVCSDCNTTKTPLWRSGPKGPKSLCNACGIRQRKARRAMAAAAANSGTSLNTHETATTLKIKVQNTNKEKIKNSVQFKKRCNKITSSESSHNNGAQKKNVFEDFLFNLSKNLAFQRVFPQDEKEAAILLMALSCGLVHG